MISIVKYKDIHKAISDKIKVKYPEMAFSTDAKEGIVKPSFFVSMGNLTAKDFNNEAMDRNITARIYYFPKTNTRLELMEIIDNLNELFIEENVIRVNNKFAFEIFEDIEMEILDDVLHYYIPIFISEDYNRQDTKEKMENLYYEEKEGNDGKYRAT